MNTMLQQKIFNSLYTSREQVLDEIATLMACQKRSEFKSEVEWYEKKYKMKFVSFDLQFKQNPGTDELENDWMAWRFSEEAYQYWDDIVKEKTP